MWKLVLKFLDMQETFLLEEASLHISKGMSDRVIAS